MATLKTVTGKVTGPDGVALATARVQIRISKATVVVGTSEIPQQTVTPTVASDGTWSASLYSNADLSPNDSYYTITESIPAGVDSFDRQMWTDEASYIITVPNSAGPFVASSLVTVVPAVLPSGHVGTLTVDGATNFTSGPVTFPDGGIWNATGAEFKGVPWFDVKAYGALGDAKQVYDGLATNGSTTLTSASGQFTASDVGKSIIVSGAGASNADLSTTIAAFTNSTTVTLTAAAGTTPVLPTTVLWGGTDDTAAIGLAITAAASGTVPGGDVFIPRGIYVISGSGLTIPDGVGLHMAPGALLSYTGTGVAITFNEVLRGRATVRLQRNTITWGAGTDTTSVGLRFKNCRWGRYDIIEVRNFETGIELRGDATAGLTKGVDHNSFNLGRVINNKRGIRVSRAGSGGTEYANSDFYYGGVIRIDGSLAGSMTGSKYIDLSDTTTSGHNFYGTSLEANAVEENVTFGGVDNMLIGCRLESISKIHFLSTATRNYVIGGYGNFGPGTSIFQDDSTAKQNIVIGARGMVSISDSSNGSAQNGGLAAYEGRSQNSSADILFRTRNITGVITFDVDGNGIWRMYTNSETFSRIRPNVAAGSGPGAYGYLGWGRGNVDVDAQMGRTSDNIPAITANVPVVPKTSAQTLASNGAVTINASLGELFLITLQANATSSSITNPVTNASGQTISQVITIEWIQDGTGGRTYVWPTNCKFAGGVAPADTTASKRSAVTFRYDGTNWLEISRAVVVG